MRGWGRDAYGEGRYGNGKAPLGHRIIVLLILCTVAWLAIWAGIYVVLT